MSEQAVPGSRPTPFKSSIRGPGGHLGFLLKGEDDVVSRDEEEEAASWLLPNPKAADDGHGVSSAQYLFGDVDPYLDVDYGSGDLKFEAGESNSSGSDGVVPVQVSGIDGDHGKDFVNGGGFDLEFAGVGAKGSRHFGYGAHCLTQSVSTCMWIHIYTYMCFCVFLYGSH